MVEMYRWSCYRIQGEGESEIRRGWEEVDDVEEEWKQYKDAFVGNAEELLWKIHGYG